MIFKHVKFRVMHTHTVNTQLRLLRYVPLHLCSHGMNVFIVWLFDNFYARTQVVILELCKNNRL